MFRVHISTVLAEPHSNKRDENWTNFINTTGSSLTQKLIQHISGSDHQSIHSLLIIPKLSYSLEWSIILHLTELTVLTLNLLSLTSSGFLSVDSLVLGTKHLKICDRVRMPQRLLELHFFSQKHFISFPLALFFISQEKINIYIEYWKYKFFNFLFFL